MCARNAPCYISTKFWLDQTSNIAIRVWSAVFGVQLQWNLPLRTTQGSQVVVLPALLGWVEYWAIGVVVEFHTPSLIQAFKFGDIGWCLDDSGWYFGNWMLCGEPASQCHDCTEPAPCVLTTSQRLGERTEGLAIWQPLYVKMPALGMTGI
jgi:hypothetical protein